MLRQAGALKGRLLSEFFNIHSVAKYQKIQEAPFGDNKKISKKVSQSQKGCSEGLIVPKKLERGDPSVLKWLLEALDAFKLEY